MERKKWRWLSRGWSRETRSLRKGVRSGVGGCARAGRELLRGLTLSSWEVSPSPHTLPMLLPQAKLPLGKGPWEILESWENGLWGPLGRSLPGYQKV